MEKKYCDRCGKPLNGCSIMSMYNTDIICMDCKREERNDPRYKRAVEADNAAIRSGNYNFKGIGWK
jgi:hypothetical protein